MSFDFAAALVLAALLTGAVYALDAWVLAPARLRMQQSSSQPVQMPWYVDWSRSFFPVIIVVLVLRSFVFEPFRIPSGSMLPTLDIGDFILVNKFSWGLRLPVLNTKILDTGSVQRGDVAVFRYPQDPSIAYIKRIVGLPGDHVVYRDKQLFVNGQPVEQSTLTSPLDTLLPGFDAREETLGEHQHAIQINPHVAEHIGMYAIPLDQGVTVPAGHYLAMGDNRDNSQDSRFWGFLPEENLIGKAFMIWMNWSCVTGNGHCARIGRFIE
ncbi:signal peptidase I [Plasticicumulans acidivorans]|uniref:Signal peptidase I n=1 Tax=Plasticicumulans acidivorans TaxID=886464 RepID=A0A317MX40_9GAMM|nr:signal peptidase I [Plasticicumulans acidivorans]PWV63371.1 signal peptidase I [Plasticicumulans acidivorans]